MSDGNTTIQCYYDILSVSRDADDNTIKKSYRKLALKWHPDKNIDNEDEANRNFRLIAAAYECLSDPAERKWYDEHRDMILSGINVHDDDDSRDVPFVFNIIPYEHFSAFDGYGTDERSFYNVYSHAFEQIIKGEEMGWKAQGNIDPLPFPSVPFGTAESEWTTVSTFYSTWENFSTCLHYAWADVYDIRTAENRKIRRLMEEENKKKRKAAKKERNDDVLSLVRFVKRRDPRVKAYKERLEREKLAKEDERNKEVERKRVESLAAREAWRLQAEQNMAKQEEEDLNAGRIRLDDDDDFFSTPKKKKKKKKKKKHHYDDDEEEQNEAINNEELINENSIDGTDNNTTLPKNEEEMTTNADDDFFKGTSKKKKKGKKKKHYHDDDDDDYKHEQNDNEELNNENSIDGTDDNIPQNEEELTTASIWKCQCCAKDFKSENEFDIHVQSKEHKQLWEETLSKTNMNADVEDALLDDFLDDTAPVQDPFITDVIQEETNSISSSEEEPEIWRCECCKKDFKSENQFGNHVKSKKHKEALKKYEKKVKSRG